MTFHRLGDVRMSHADAVFRESPWNKASAVITCLFLTGVAAWVAISSQSIVFGISTALMVLMTALFVSLYLKTLSAANWLMRITPREEVIVKYRSFANAHFPAEDEVAFTLERDEIMWAGKLMRKSILPSSEQNGVEKQTTTYLELGVDPQLTEQIEQALAEERARPAPSSRMKSLDYPVSVPEPGVIRLRWRSKSSWISPKMDVAIARLPRGIEVREARETMTDFVNIKKPDAEAEARILELAESGDTIAATKLVRRVYGMSLTDARKFVDELIGRKTSSIET